MKRPIGVTILAILAGIAGVAQLWRAGVYMGWFNFETRRSEHDAARCRDPEWGAVLWTLLIAAIWFWVAAQFWNMRAAGWQFGVFISLFTLIWGFFALLFGSTVNAETFPMLLALIVYVYLMWPGVRDAFAQADEPPDAGAEGRLRAARRGNSKAGSTPPEPTAVLTEHHAGDGRCSFLAATR